MPNTMKPSLRVAVGYEARYLWPLFTATLAAALLLNEFVAPHHIGAVPHAAVVALAGIALAAHEVARPCAANCSDVAVLLRGAVISSTQAFVQHACRGFRPRFEGWSGAFHIVQAVLSYISLRHGHAVFWLHNAQYFRRNADWFGRVQGALSCLLHGTTLERFQYNGLEHLWLRARDAVAITDATAQQQRKQQQLVVLYFHGGGYSSMSPHVYTDFCNRLRACIVDEIANHCELGTTGGVDVHMLIANFRKLPEVEYPVPVDDCVVMYEYVTTQLGVAPRDIVLAGDSAGAGLVLSTLLRARDALAQRKAMTSSSTTNNHELALLAICSCPFVDLSGSETVVSHCIMQPTVSHALRTNCMPELAPVGVWEEAHLVVRDLAGLPPLLIQTGTFDVFHCHALRLAERAQTDGVTGCELDIHAEMPHVFSVFPKWLLPGSERGIERMAQFTVKHVAQYRKDSQQQQQ